MPGIDDIAPLAEQKALGEALAIDLRGSLPEQVPHERRRGDVGLAKSSRIHLVGNAVDRVHRNALRDIGLIACQILQPRFERIRQCL